MKNRLFIFGSVVVAITVAVIVWWSNAPTQDFSARPWSAPTPTKPVLAKPSISSPSASIPPAPPRDRRAIDPEIQKLADRLVEHAQTPLNDLETVNEFVDLYHKTFSHMPVGSNEDLTAILTGSNPMKGVLFPADSPMIVKGQIVDRWGTPYWMHPNSGARIEVRSAGPDKDLFTPDDLILNASPSGLGVTPRLTQ